MFSEYDEYLSGDLGDDYWSDDGFSYAEKLLISFSPEDWAKLSDSWHQRTAQWKYRCADTLDSKPCPESFAILLSVAGDANDDVVCSALDSLRAFPEATAVMEIRRAWAPRTSASLA